MSEADDTRVAVMVSEWAWKSVLNAKQRRWVMRRAMRQFNKTAALQQAEVHPLLDRSIADLWKRG